MLTALCQNEEWLQWRFKHNYLDGDLVSESETRREPAFYGTLVYSNEADDAYVKDWLQEHAGASSSAYPTKESGGYTATSAWHEHREITNVRQEADGLHYDINLVVENWFLYATSEWTNDDFAVDVLLFMPSLIALALMLSYFATSTIDFKNLRRKKRETRFC